MIHHGDCIEVMRTFEADSIDAICTDPPYGLGFMGKEWDSAKAMHLPPSAEALDTPLARFRTGKGPEAVAWNGKAYQAWCTEWAREAFRVAKPGAYLLAFGGTRTVHRLASAIEDAGWEIRDELIWVYASGFPKSLDVSKALDKAAGAEREDLGQSPNWRESKRNREDFGSMEVRGENAGRVTAPATDLAKQWEGWGTALKPAHEPIVMARKPLVGSVAANVTRYGTGAINIGATRIVNGDDTTTRHSSSSSSYLTGEIGQVQPKQEPYTTGGTSGRWPSNLLLSDPELFDVANPGVVGSGASAVSGWRNEDRPDGKSGIADSFGAASVTGEHYGDSGGYSRFFIIPKADRADREPVLRGQVEPAGWTDGREKQIDNPRLRMNKQRENAHPTVKPTDLMRHLVRLVTPPSGTVLDCFLGSGSTAIACEMEGFAWIGIEKEAEYVAIAEARLNGVQRGLGLDVPAPTRTFKPNTNTNPARFQKTNGGSFSKPYGNQMAVSDEV